MKCEKCGTENVKCNFCTNCGSKLKETCECWIKKNRITVAKKSAQVIGFIRILFSKNNFLSTFKSNKKKPNGFSWFALGFSICTLIVTFIRTLKG